MLEDGMCGLGCFEVGPLESLGILALGIMVAVFYSLAGWRRIGVDP